MSLDALRFSGNGPIISFGRQQQDVAAAGNTPPAPTGPTCAKAGKRAAYAPALATYPGQNGTRLNTFA
ncbi:MAG: hypothetical protein IPK79_05530 [Vampirovibrionales bacterium]|nr:hypothetical protein [Vampirovibrionales bacterium]